MLEIYAKSINSSLNVKPHCTNVPLYPNGFHFSTSIDAEYVNAMKDKGIKLVLVQNRLIRYLTSYEKYFV